MTEQAKTKNPVSLDALLSANKEQFDRLFEHQMTSGPAQRPVTQEVRPQEIEAGTPSPPGVGSAPAAVEAGHENLVAELNKRFTVDWSTEILERQIQNGRAVLRCKLTVGNAGCIESGSSRVGEDGDEEAAFRRAFDRALKKCADRFLGARQNSEPAPPAPPTPLSAPLSARRAALQAMPLDAVTVNRVEAALIGTMREMETVLARSALSPALHDHQAEPAMIMDGQGHMIAGHHGSYLSHMLRARKLHFAPGDVLLQSDPYDSQGAAGHLNDWLVLLPIFHESDLVGFASMYGHLSDVGGSADGSMPADARSIFGEGVRIPPIKIYQAGVLNDAALDVILANSRTPNANRADLMALVEACRAGEANVIRLCERVGPELYHRCCTALLERTNHAVRRLIVERIPEEPQSFEDQIDDDGCGNGPFKLKLTVWREDDHAYFDWTGTSAQAPGPVNFYLHVGLAKMFVGQYLTRAFGPDVLSNDGYYELIHVTLPKGSLLNPDFPAAVGRREHALTRQLDVLGGAIDRHAPDELAAAGYGSSPSFSYAGAGFRMTDPVFGGLPGRPGSDGMDGHAQWPDDENTPAEHLESNFPIVIERYASIPESGGAGKFRGGHGVEKVYRLLEAGHVSVHDDRHSSRPWGVRGGKAGQPSQKRIERADGTREALPSKVEGLAVGPGDRIVFRTAGGGGCGDPLDRDPLLVRRDAACGLLTVEAAGSLYGVILNGQPLEIDAQATGELRNRLKRERKDLKLFDRGDQT